MKHLFLKFTKKTFGILFLGMSLLLLSQGMMAQKTSTQSGPWTDTATWGGAGVPNTTESVIIAAGHAVTFPLTANTTIGGLTIQNTGSLTVSNNFTLSIGSASSSTIAGSLTITGTSSRSIGNLTVASTGIINSTTGATSINASNNTWVNNGTITMSTLGLGTDTTRIVTNNGTFTTSMGSTSQGTFNNSSGATLTLTGTVAGYINNFGTLNSGSLTGTAAVAVITNKSTGTFNFSGGQMTASYLVLNASEAGNTVIYSNATGLATVRDVNYHHLTISGTSGTKTWAQAADRTVGGDLTINSPLTLRVSSASVGSVSIAGGGSGYASVPNVTFSAPAAGATAAGTAFLTSGVVTSILITNAGSGYTSAPTVTIGTPWVASTNFTANSQVSSGGRLYTVNPGGITGTVAPTHTSGSVVDGAATLTYVGVVATATATLISGTPTFKLTVNGTTINNGTLNFDSFAGTGDKTFATFNNPGTLTSTAAANFICTTADYSAAGAQTILPGTYTNLTLSGSGTKTLPQTADMTLSGNLNIGTGVTLNVTSGSVSSVTIPGGNGGTLYTVAPTATFTAAPSGGTTATGTAILTGGIVTSVAITNRGSGYTSAPTVTFTAGTTTGTAATTATTTIATVPTAYKFTVNGTTTNNGTLNFDAFAGTGDKTFAIFNNPGAITTAASASFIFITADYSAAGAQTVLPGTYTNLTLSGSGTKTIGTAASGTLCTGKMTISGTGGSSGVRANVTNANVAVNTLILNTTGQVAGTIGFTGSGATTINSTYFVTGTGTLNVQQNYAITSTAAGGDWNTASTWVDGVVPTNSSADYVVIVGTATVNLTLTQAFTVGALNIISGGTLNVTGGFGFSTASRSPFSNIAGSLNLDGTTLSKSFGTITVASGGIINSLGGATSIGSTASSSSSWVNNGTITVVTLGMTPAKTIENNGTFNAQGIGSTGSGTFNNNSTGVFNYSGGSVPAAVILTATAAGNTLNYNGTAQTIKDTSYSNLTLSGSSTKTLQQAADRTVSGNLTIGSGVTLNVTSSSVSSVTIPGGNEGTLYTVAPTATFDAAPSGGTTATGTAVITGGVVSSVLITNPGSGYTSAPTVTFTGGTTTGTAATTATTTIAALPTTYKFTVTGTTTNNGTLNFDAFAGTGDKTVTTFNNPGTITSTASANFICTTADYSGAAQTILPGTYTTLTLSGSGTKTIPTAASGTLCTGTMTISGTAKANVTNTNVLVNKLFLGTTGQVGGTIGFTGSGATTIDTAYFVTGLGTLNVQQSFAITSTAAGGNWNSASTWVDGVVPANSSADYVVIVGTATVTLNLTSNFTVGALSINQGGKLNVSQDATARSFTIGTRAPGSIIAGDLLFDASVTGGKTFGTVTVTATGSVIETTKVSISVTTGTAITNYGTITTATLAPTAATTNFYNYGTINASGFSSLTLGTFTNYSSGTLNFGGTIAGNLRNYGIVNATSLSGSSAVANIFNYSTGVLNFTGSSMSSTTLVLDASEAGNTVNYNGTTQTVKDVVYSNLNLSNSGTKTIPTVASGSLCTGKMTISGTAKASVTNANIGVNMLFLGSSGQSAGTIGFTGSGATTIDTAYFVTGSGTLNVQQTYAITSTAVGGDWNSASTWVDGVVPANSNADYVVIVSTATVTLNLTSNFTVGALSINQGGTLNVSQDATARSFTLGTKLPGCNIAGALLFDASVTGGKTVGNVTVTATGSFIETTKVSISITAGYAITNNGTITTNTLASTAANTNVYNYGTINAGGFSSATQGTFTNYSSGTLNFGGTMAGNLKNYGIVNATSMSSGALYANNFYNYSTGVLNYTGSSITSTTLVLDTSDPGNTVNYGFAGTQTVKDVVYSNLILSNSGTKTIPTAASGILCTGRMTISGAGGSSGVRANITNANVAVNLLFLGSSGQASGTIGFTGSGATTINTTYFVTGTGTLNVQQNYAITSTAAGGDWNTASTWVDGVVPSNANSDYVVIVGTATVTLNLTSNFTVGALDIIQGGKLNVSQDATARTFTLGTRTPGSTIAGALLFDASVTGGKTVGNVTVTATGSIIETTKVSISVTAGYAITNNGTITTNTLAPTAVNTNVYNYGTMTIGAFSSGTLGAFTNYNSGTLNYTGGSVPALMTFIASATGNTVNYNGTTQTVRIPNTGSYSKLILSNSGTKTIDTSASGTLCTGTMFISGSAKANVTNTNVGVDKLVLGSSGQIPGTIGFTGSGATTINTTYFITGLGTLNVQQMYSITSTAAGGDWNTTSTWVDGVVPANSSADYVVIVGTATVTLNLTSAFTVGALDINQGGTLNVSQDPTARTFTLGTRAPGSTIAGALLFGASVTGGKTFGTVTVTATGSVIETTKVSISVTTGTAITNYGTITTATLAPTAANTNFYNYGTINGSGFSSVTLGTFTNYSSGTLNFGGTIGGNLKNYGIVNATNLSGSSAVANIYNYSTGVLNFTGGSMSSTTLVLDTSDPGNTVNYSFAGSQTVKDVVYSNLVLSNSGTKTITTAASGILCTGKMTISGAGGSSGVRANITNANVAVNLLFLGSTGQAAGTIGFTGSGATTIDTTYFVTGLGTLNVQQTYAITSTAAGGDWNTASTWVDGVVPANSGADYVVIVAGAPVTLTLTTGFTVGAIKINSGGTLNVTGAFGFSIVSRSPYSSIAGSLNLDSTTLSKSFGTITVASGGIISSLGGATSIGSSAASSSSWVNNGTLTVVTLGLTAAKAIENNGTFNASGIGSTGSGTFNNNNGATLNLTGTVTGNINNFGIMNSAGLSGTSAVANITNKASGVLNFTGGSMTSTTLVLDASAAGNTVNYSLAGNQTIKPVGYSNLILSNSGIKTVDVATSITIPSGGVVTVNEGITLNNLGTITNNGDIILKSTTIGSASLTSTSSISNVTQRRYLSSNQRGWRLLSNPLASTTFNTLAAASGITIGNNFTGEYITSSNTFTSTGGTATMDTQKAYKVFITGLSGESPAYTTGPSNVTLVNKGTAANTEPAVITTTLGDYYLVANPYTAPVSVASIIGASTGLSSTVAYYNPTNGATDVKVKAGGYDTATATGTAGSASDVVIPAMGAIFMQASTAGTINIPTSTIFTGTPAQSGTYNHKSTYDKVAAANALKLEVRSGGVYYDALSLHFKAVGEAGSNIDFGKLPNSILDAYSIVGTKKMAVSEVELTPQIIPLGITSTIQKSYTFKVVENTIPAGFEAVLVDKVLNTSTVLTLGTIYNFAVDSTPASQGDGRFAINLKVANSLSVVDAALDSKIQIWPNPAHGQFNILNGQNQQDGTSTIEISNLNGKIIHSHKSNPGSTTTIQTKGWVPGVYILRVKNTGNQSIKKLIVQ